MCVCVVCVRQVRRIEGDSMGIAVIKEHSFLFTNDLEHFILKRAESLETITPRPRTKKSAHWKV